MKKRISIIALAFSGLCYANDNEPTYFDACHDNQFIENNHYKFPANMNCVQAIMSQDYSTMGALFEHYFKNNDIRAFDVSQVFVTNPQYLEPGSTPDYDPFYRYIRFYGQMMENGSHGAPHEPDYAYQAYYSAMKLGDITSIKLLADLISDSRPDAQATLMIEYNRLKAYENL